MQYTTTNISAIIAGTGGQKENYQNLIDSLNLANKVKLIGYISQEEKETYYARSLGVFFAPFDEDRRILQNCDRNSTGRALSADQT